MKRDGARFVDYRGLTGSAAAELERGAQRRVGLQLVCDLLRREVDHYDWVGFYLAAPEDSLLVLGPFSGRPVNDSRIPYGRGACGRVAQSGNSLRSDLDISDRNPAVRSRIVVPVFLDGNAKEGTQSEEFVAEIVIDSGRPAAFSAADEQFLQTLAAMAAPFVPRIPTDAR